MNIFAHEGQPDIYRGFERILVVQRRTEAALEVAEQGRSKAVEHLLATRLGPEGKCLGSVEPPSLYKIKQIAKAHNSTLVYYSLIYDYQQFYEMSRLQIGIKTLYAYATELFIWVISPSGKIDFRQVDLQSVWYEDNTSLAGLVRSVRELINVGYSDRERLLCRQQLQFLYQILIAPIADLLPKDPQKRVTIIPQDFLFLVPFAALIDSNGQYPIEKHTLLTAPSIQALGVTQRQREPLVERELAFQTVGGNSSPHCCLTLESLQECLVVGNPTMPSICLEFGEPPVQLLQIPGTQLEAEAIAQVLKTQPITGDRATKSAILQKMGSANIIHLATHVFLDDIEGLQSAIAFAPSPNTHGLMTINDILHLNLTAQLVVLSGCDTGRGRIWGDGVVELSQAFITAGVPSLLMSLWLPPTTSNLDFMKEFYYQFRQTCDKAQSLRTAMLTTMEQYPNPRDWAAFTLIGEA
ncbi:CHAT domain-containing protein [Laspinema sp. A4]|uniref:CHAT domain-containing protein n=1 Tax=Laspinema sp. D2d TaxID=2953686 RepID=UPI0021BB2947|nr:CHAT domain-containing protein [Laspinema sp. D2d]MCT7983763.1 CHAT domain-containing protein [Laspinema sp. D2d]